MPIYTEDNTRTVFIEELPVSTLTAADATAAETFVRSPASSLFRGATQLYAEYVEESPLLSAEEARRRVSEANVKLTVPDSGIKENVLNLLIDRKNNEMRRQSIIERGPDGFIPGAINLGASLGASLLDPINVASAFIPVYGQTRYTSMLANAGSGFGRAAVRARVGAVEGAVGTALTEGLIVAPVAFYEQADYNSTDFLESVAFGTIFGGGLHAGVGALSDAFARNATIRDATPLDAPLPQALNRVAPETRNDAIRNALSQALSGRNIDVDGFLRLDPRFEDVRTRALETTSIVPMRDTPIPGGITQTQDMIGAAVNPQMIEPPSRVMTGAVTKTGELPTYATLDEAEKVRDRLLRRTGEDLVVQSQTDGSFVLMRPFDAQPVRRPDGTPMAFDTARAAEKAKVGITDLRDRDISVVPFMDNGEMRFALVENAPKQLIDAAKKNPSLVDLGLGEDRSINALNKQYDRDLQSVKFAREYEKARQSFRPENMRLADMDAVIFGNRIYEETRVDQTIESLQKEIEFHQAELQRVADTLGVRDMADAEMKKYDDLIADTEAAGRGYEAAASCIIRRGF